MEFSAWNRHRIVRLAFGTGIALACAGVQAEPSVTAELNACEAAIGNEPRTAMQACLSARLKDAQGELKRAYARAHDELKAIDSSATPHALQALKASRESFNAFMDKECKRQGAALLGGSGAGDVELACQVALTRWRADALRQD
jgi:uncharacterized protein YecT (DUF1311 family)